MEITYVNDGVNVRAVCSLASASNCPNAGHVIIIYSV